MKLKVKLLALMTLPLLSACTTTIVGDPYFAAWYDIYGNACSYNVGAPYPGCNYSWNGIKIRAWQDPYGALWQQGAYWLSPTGIYYDPWGNALNAQSNEVSPDLISAAAADDEQLISQAGQSLAQEYALAETKGIQIARSLQSWSALGNTRTRTEADIADFAERLYGIKADRIKIALTQAEAARSLEPIENLNIDVAAFWGTTPETSKIILKKWHEGEMQRHLNASLR